MSAQVVKQLACLLEQCIRDLPFLMVAGRERFPYLRARLEDEFQRALIDNLVCFQA